MHGTYFRHCGVTGSVTERVFISELHDDLVRRVFCTLPPVVGFFLLLGTSLEADILSDRFLFEALLILQ